MKKFTASSQQLKSDPRYNSKLVSKFINCMMTGGRKSVAQCTFYDAMGIISKELKTKNSRLKTVENPLEVFETAKMMCTYELALGGTLKLLDSDGGLVAEHRGRVATST